MVNPRSVRPQCSLPSSKSNCLVWSINLRSVWPQYSLPCTKSTAWFGLLIPGLYGHTTVYHALSQAAWFGLLIPGLYGHSLVYHALSQAAWFGLLISGLYGHSAVYHALSQAIYVFGGYEYLTDRTSVANNLYALDLKNRSNLRNISWAILPSDSDNQVSHFNYCNSNLSKISLTLCHVRLCPVTCKKVYKIFLKDVHASFAKQ